MGYHAQAHILCKMWGQQTWYDHVMQLTEQESCF